MRTVEKCLMGLGAAILLASAATAQQPAVQGRISTFIEPNHIITRFQSTEFAENVKKASGGKIVFEVFAGGALLPATGSLQGIASGVAHTGLLPPSVWPSQLPVLNALGDHGFVKPDSFVLPFAYADFTFSEKIPYEQWRQNGIIYGGGHATPPYHYLCRDANIRTLADLKGKKARMPGAGWSRFSNSIGLTTVNIPASEIYTALERGAIDCVCGDLTLLVSGATIGAMVKSAVLVNLPPFFASAGIGWNVPFWQGLTNEQRRILLDEAARSMVRLQVAYAKEEKEALDWAKAKGIAVVEPEPALKKALDDWVANGIGGAAQIARDNFKVQNPEAVFKLFEGYVAKWEKLLAGVDRTNEEALFRLLKAEAFDKVDVTKYGMN